MSQDAPTAEAVKARIHQAFANARYPGDDRLRGSDLGDEPFEVERDFRGKREWQALEARFIDLAPDGLASALSFFSHEAFCFYLPAYMIADVDGKLEHSTPLFHLTQGLENESARGCINPQRYGEKTWGDYRRERFAGFTADQSGAIVAYLQFMRDAPDTGDGERRQIAEALENYWQARAA